MKDFLTGFGMLLVLGSVFAFIVGFFMLFIEKSRKTGLKLMLISVITFIIGFGTCAANFSLGNMH